MDDETAKDNRPPHSGDGEPYAESVDRTSGKGQSEGVPAAGLPDESSYSPTGGPGVLHWQEGTITRPGLDDRGGVFFAAIEMTRMPMILTDPNRPDNPIAFANRAFLDLTGYAEDEVVGRNCRFLQGAQTNPDTVSELRDAVLAKRAISTEILNYKRDGTPFWNAVFVGPVFDRGGKLLYFFASQLDVTRRRSSEQAFRQAQKMEAIGQLTAGLAHDFNNLLQVVEGNLEIVADDPLTDRQRRALDTAMRSVERGSRLTRQLLAFARRTRLEPKPINLNALFIEFGDMLSSTLGSSVELVLNLKQRLPACLVDPTHLEMALLNVLINARDALGPKGGVVTASTELVRLDADTEAHELPPGEYIALSVRDEGPGMPPRVLERATEPFFTTKEVGKGTGLGLAMVQGFVQQSRGRLELDSTPGRGTTVRMLFPTTAQAEALAAESRSPASTGRALQDDPRGMAETILVVEDSDDVLDLARNHLSNLGYTVLTARSGEEALAAYEAAGGHVDILFTDIAMPGGINGLVLAQRLRERQPGLPVLLTTGYNDELVTDGPGAPGMDVLGKPYRRSELADRVRAALNQAAARHARGETVEAPRRQPRQPNPAAEG
ncbi:histidine kinase famiy protein [Salinarimonas soli]|uniref:histidine kinase n=1 Tax=Salinarimonas soli TaxID=1638099 RepID=A0A5B2VE47_9HYPH|nr:histidine kinase famiy protein [Salinarimonas soli]KAA2236692.1 PAS domain-containing protein [Salinarimonas soli]